MSKQLKIVARIETYQFVSLHDGSGLQRQTISKRACFRDDKSSLRANSGSFCCSRVLVSEHVRANCGSPTHIRLQKNGGFSAESSSGPDPISRLDPDPA